VSVSKLEGPNAITEAIRAGRQIDKLYAVKSGNSKAAAKVISLARESGAVIVDTDRRQLDKLSETGAHQGLIAFVSEYEYSTVHDILAAAARRDEAPLIVICDGINDPHNLGAIMRTAECAGAHGVIIPKRRSAGFSAAVVEKSSAGAISYIPTARVANISSLMRELKDAGIWVCGLAARSGAEFSEFPTLSESSEFFAIWDCDFTVPLAIAVGSEGAGLSRLNSENCDFLVNIPLYGKVNSLNASAAAAIALYEAVRQRRKLI